MLQDIILQQGFVFKIYAKQGQHIVQPVTNKLELNVLHVSLGSFLSAQDAFQNNAQQHLLNQDVLSVRQLCLFVPSVQYQAMSYLGQLAEQLQQLPQLVLLHKMDVKNVLMQTNA